MLSKSSISVGLALLLALILTIPVFAGGWAVITLDELPTDVVAGEELTIGFTVRQHGIRPMDGLDPSVTARLPTGEEFVVAAEADDKPGHYTARLTFPQEGKWEWSIQAFTMDQPMPALQVTASTAAAANPPAAKSEPTSVALDPLLTTRLLLFGVALAGLVFAFQKHSRLAGALAGVCLVLGVGTSLIGAATAEAQGKESSDLSIGASPSQVELGRQLFLAKGCITCHYNDRAADRNDYWTIDMGAPDLSRYSAHAEVLFIRLKDPVAAKSDSKMPNLELKETEIQALIAFINSR
jgi:cytochrome c